MAVVLHLSVSPATRDTHDDLDARMGALLMEAGGPPEGLMSHLVYPDGDGFVITGVWRTKREGMAFFDEMLRPLLADSGLSFVGPTPLPLWGFARPQ